MIITKKASVEPLWVAEHHLPASELESHISFCDLQARIQFLAVKSKIYQEIDETRRWQPPESQRPVSQLLMENSTQRIALR